MIDLTEFESRAVPLRALGVVVSQNGTQLARRLWDDTCRRNVYSASKSFTSMAVGIAQKEGLLSIDEKLTDAFKDDLPEIVSDNLKAATVRDLLTMCLFGAGGLFLTIDELHLFGQLLLQNGEWNGKQLIPAEWVKEATSKQVENGSEGYGYLFWAGPEGSFRADGKYGQFVILMRDKNAVVTVTAESRDAGALLRAVFEEIYPQL